MRKAAIAAVVAAAVSFPPVAEAGIQDVGVGIMDSEFEPDVVRGRVSGIELRVTWAADEASPPNAQHNVRETSKIFYSGPPQTWGTDKTFARTFSAGTFAYRCELHPSMTGVVRVRVGIDTADALPRVIWATTDTNTGRAFDVQFKVGDGRWRNWKTDTDVTEGVFGRNGRPVPYDPDKTYRFRARSQKRTDTPRRVSGWSPLAVLA